MVFGRFTLQNYNLMRRDLNLNKINTLYKCNKKRIGSICGLLRNL